MNGLKYLRNEEGLVLVVSLMLLLTLTVMGLAAISTTSTEIKISGNERANAQAFHAAEAGLREMLHRIALSPGSMVTVKDTGGDVIFDASISDPGWTPATCLSNPDPCPNPDWTASIFYAAAEPADPDGNTDYTRTILPDGSWADIHYATSDTNDPGMAVTVRYARESDYANLNPPISNLDGDDDDLVFYNTNVNPPIREPAPDNATGGDEDFNPPAGLANDDAIRFVTIRGHNGNAQKTIVLEMADFPINPNVNSAVTADIVINMRGNTFVSGFNHTADTTPSDSSDRDSLLYENNDCDNLGKKGEAYQACAPGSEPDGSNQADYSGKFDASGGHKPAILFPPGDDPTFNGNAAEVWGGELGNTPDTIGWAKENAAGFPELYDMLGITADELTDVLANANVTDANADTACPVGVTYLQNSGGLEYRPPNSCGSGSGIMFIEGDLKFSSQFEFRGLIYVLGDANLSGGTWILGAVAVKGTANGTKFQSGNPTILYSEQTVLNEVEAALTQAGFAFTFLSWNEY